MASKHLWKTKLTSNDSTAQEELGIKRVEFDSTDNVWKNYRYVRYYDGTAAAGAAAKGNILVWYNTNADGYSVVLDISDGSQAGFAGVAVGTITDTYYAWVQCGGFCNNIDTDNGVVAGDSLIVDTVDGDADTMATTEEHYVFGYALADDVGTTLSKAIIFDR